MPYVLADAAENLYPAREQMALSLGWHIVFSCFGVAFPVIVVFAEWRGHRTGDAALTELAHTWAKAMGVLFAAGAVSGTLLSFEMGILWPGLMSRFGEIFGFPFVAGGLRLLHRGDLRRASTCSAGTGCRRARTCCARVPMIVAGVGRRVLRRRRERLDEQPRSASGSAPTAGGRRRARRRRCSTRRRRRRSLHMSSRPSWSSGSSSPRSTRWACCAAAADRYHRLRPAHPADRRRGRRARSRSASATGSPAPSPRTSRRSWPRWRALYRTEAGAPLSLGGIYYDNELHYALEIPSGLSLLVHHDPDGVVPGLEERPAGRTGRRSTSCTWPTTRWSGSARRCCCSALVVRLRVVAAARACPARRGSCAPSRCPGSPPWPRWRRAGSPPRSAASRGSSTGILRTADAVSPAPGLWLGFYAVVADLRRADRRSRCTCCAGCAGRARRARAAGGRRRGRPTTGRGGRADDRWPSVVLGVMFVGLIAYALFGGADFGAGIWDLLAGGTPPRCRASATLIEHSIGAGVGGQPRLADLRAGRAVDGVPAGVRRGRHHAVHPADPRGVRDDRPRRGVRVPQEHHHAAACGASSAPRSRLSSLVTPFFLGTVVGGVASGRVPPGHRRRRRRHQLAQPHLGPRRRARRRSSAPTCRGVPLPRRPPRGRTTTWRTSSASGRWAPPATTGVVGLVGIFVLRADAPLLFDGPDRARRCR